MRLVGRVIQLVCGLVLIVVGFTGEGFMAAGVFGIFIAIWGIWDIYREMNPDKQSVADLEEKLQSIKDREDEEAQ